MGLVYSDPGFAELFGKLYCSEEWRSGVATGSIIATLEDFLGDYQRMVDPGFYRRRACAASLLALHGGGGGGH